MRLHSVGNGGDAGDGESEVVRVCIELFAHPEKWFGVEVAPSPYVSLKFVNVFLCPVELMPATFIESAHEV